MIKSVALGALAAAVLFVSLDNAEARHRRHFRHVYYDPLGISYLHNYGPGPYPDTYAFYDGPLRANCKQSAAAYRGQDGRRHPCF